MRRKDREIEDNAVIEEILGKAQVCRIALCDDGVPYIVPMCFGYEDGALYLHSARKGRKIDIARANPKVCFEVDIDTELVRGTLACGWTMRYRSVIGYGSVRFLEDQQQKAAGLNVLMRHYSGRSFEFPPERLEAIALWRIDIESMTGKGNLPG